MLNILQSWNKILLLYCILLQELLYLKIEKKEEPFKPL